MMDQDKVVKLLIPISENEKVQYRALLDEIKLKFLQHADDPAPKWKTDIANQQVMSWIVGLESELNKSEKEFSNRWYVDHVVEQLERLKDEFDESYCSF